MTVQWSAAVRNGMLDAWETAIGTSAVLKIYTGAVPANCAASTTGTVLVTFSLASDWAAAAASGAKNLNSLPLSATSSAAGVAGYYRIFASDGTTCHEQGTVSTTGLGGDLILDNVNIATGQTVVLTVASKTMPGA